MSEDLLPNCTKENIACSLKTTEMNDRNIQFWLDYWDSLFGGIEYGRSTLNMVNARVAIRELIDEAQTNQLKNSVNRDFLYAQVTSLLKHDPPTQVTLRPILSVMSKEFANPRLAVLTQLAKRALAELDSLSYFDAAVDGLRESLLGMNPVKREDLKLLCQDIIIELSERGYSRKYISRLPSALFSGIDQHKKVVSTFFPHNLPLPARNAQQADVEEYYQRVMSYVANLTNADRINQLKKVIRKQPESLRIVLQVKGLRGDHSFRLGDIEFYSPNKQKIIEDMRCMPASPNPELFGAREYVYMNACVPVQSIDIESGLARARNKLLRAIGILRYCLPSEAHYEINQDYVAVDASGALKGTSSSISKREGLFHWSDSLQVDEDMVGRIRASDIMRDLGDGILQVGEQPLMLKISDSLQWYRKGTEAESEVDRFISFWISLENLLNPGKRALEGGVLVGRGKETVVTMAFDVLPRIASVSNAYRRGWALYHKLRTLNSGPLSRLFAAQFPTIPDELKKKAGFSAKPGMDIYLKDFTEAIPELIPYYKGSLLEEQMLELRLFYEDKAIAEETLHSDRKRFHDEIVLEPVS